MIRQPFYPVLLLVALIAVALPVSAAARVRLPYPDNRSDEPPGIDLAGERLVATKRLSADSPTYSSPRRVGVFAAPVSGAGAWRLLHSETLRVQPNEDFISFEVSASADRLVLLRHGIRREGVEQVLRVGGSIRAGPLGGPLASLPLCGGTGLLSSPAVDGRLVAYVAASCSPTEVTVRDPLRPASSARSFSLGGNVDSVALAGRYLAALVGDEDKGEIVLLDHSTGRTVLRIPAPTAVGLAVQADGTVAVSLRAETEAMQTFIPDPLACPAYRVEWFSPGQPDPRSLAEPACGPRVRIAAGRIAYLSGRRIDDQRLVLAGLDGTPGHIVARSVQTRQYPLAGFDWDGARVAYREERCIDSAVVVAGPEEPTQTFAPLCPIEILSGSARLSRDNSLGIRVRCANGCDGGELGFSGPKYLHYNRTPGRLVRFRVGPGKIETVRVRLSRRQAARLRREGSVRARAKAFSLYSREVKYLVLRAGG